MATSVHPAASQVRDELNRILATDIFTRSGRLSAYLKFIVERTLDGEGDTLKEQVIATELYGKGTDFNAAADPIVRVDARRLRDRLREYYASAPPGELVISVPKGSYTPEFIPTPTPPPVTDIPAPAALRRRVLAMWWMAGAAVVVVAAGWLIANRLARPAFEPTRLLTVTSLPGAEDDPALSPDGNLVAFSWSGSSGNLNADLWVKEVDGDVMHQLTDTPHANEKFPEWSRDGQSIAFVRLAIGNSSVWTVSALGGPERLVAQASSFPSWLPDGKSLVMIARAPDGRASLVRHVLESGARERLTEAPVGFTDSHSKVSPDGTTVAFVRQAVGRSAVFLKTLSGGEPTQEVDWVSGPIGGLVWTPDGRELIYGRPETSGRRLVRVVVGSHQPGTPVTGVPLGSLASSVSRPRVDGSYRLAVMSGQPDIGLKLVDLQAPLKDGTIAATPFCDSTRMDLPGHFSRDGSRVAFVSDRTGSQQVWTAERDQSGLRSLTRLQDATIHGGSWSPDGRSIVFGTTIADNTDIYVASIDGEPLRRLTNGPATETDPEWSHDGRWIFYASNETGQSEVWKMSVDGQTRLKLTSEGGFDPRESPDGQFVYYVATPRSYGLGRGTALKRVSTQGGAPSLVYTGVVPGAWDLAGDRVAFLVARPGANVNDEPDLLATYDVVRQQVQQLGALAFRVAPFFADRFITVSPDGRWALMPTVDNWNRDIFVVNNLR